MSGRSAHVRIKNTKVKESLAVTHDGNSQPSIPSLREFPMPTQSSPHLYQKEMYLPVRKHNTTSDHATIRSHTSDRSDEGNSAYARARKVPTPVIDVSGIEKSSFRQMMDKKSEGFRKGVSRTFGGGKKNKKTAGDSSRPFTAAGIRSTAQDMDEEEFGAAPAPSVPRSKFQYSREERNTEQDYIRPAPPPPQTKLPPVPEDSGLKRWTGNGRPPQSWNNLRRDTELWDHQGDTLVYLCSEGHKAARPAAAFRVSSHVIEATESPFLINLLHDGAIDDGYSLMAPPSPLNTGIKAPGRRGRMPHIPPTPEGSTGGWETEVIYEMYFPTPHGLNKGEALRYQATTRNVFALLYQVSLVGFNLYEALSDLTERLAAYIPQDLDTANMVIEYVLEKGFDDVRENPSGAAALLAWSERADVRWDEGWREGFVHAAGMYTRVEASNNFKDISTITKAFLNRASLEMQVRVESAEKHLEKFDPSDMWPKMHSQPPPAQAAFQRLKTFFLHHYQSMYQTWPPPAPAAAGGEQWLTRSLVKKLQGDFGALYDYLVNREVVWDGSQERNGRKWNLKIPGNSSFNPDTPDLPFTDILVAFDNRHRFVHIPHPYPLVPDPAPFSTSQLADSYGKSGSQQVNRTVDRMAERKAALAYTESTNIYVLGSDFINNSLVEAYSRFEKADCASGIDPYAARRGRWVLIYGILQVLSSVSVDTPQLRCKSDITYHLSPSLKGTPPWRPNGFEEASQAGSHCWTVRAKWNPEPIIPTRRGPPTSVSRNTAPSLYSESDAGSSYRSATMTSITASSRSQNHSHLSHEKRREARSQRLFLSSDQTLPGVGYSPSTDKAMDFAIPELRERESRAELRSRSRAESTGLGEEIGSRAASVSTRGDGQRSRAGSVRGKERAELPRDFTIPDFEGYSFKEGGGSLGGEWVSGRRISD